VHKVPARVRTVQYRANLGQSAVFYVARGSNQLDDARLLSRRIERKQLLGMRYAAQGVSTDGNETTSDVSDLGKRR
jgi:hypothetical protein